MNKPFSNDDKSLVVREKDLVNIIKDVMSVYLANKDLTLSDAELLSFFKYHDEEIEAIKRKPPRDKEFPYKDNFSLKIPKNNINPITIEVEGVDLVDKYIGFAIKFPLRIFTSKIQLAHSIWSNKYAIQTVGKVNYGIDTTTNQDYDILTININNMKKGTCIVSSLNEFIVPLDNGESAETNMLVDLEPDNNIPIVPNVEHIVRSHTIKYIEGIRRSDYELLRIANTTSDDTLYAVREDDKTDNLEFTFSSKEVAMSKIPSLYEGLKSVWHLVTLKFSDDVTEIDGLFKGLEHTATVRSIVGNNIVSAKELYFGTKIGSISPTLIQGLPSLENIDRGFANNVDLLKIPTFEDMFGLSFNIRSAKYLFDGCISIDKDPLYWTRKIGGRYPDFTGYMNRPTDKIVAPIPYQEYNTNAIYPVGYEYSTLEFETVEQFKTYYPDYMTKWNLPNINDLSAMYVKINRGNIDGMFKDTTITNLPRGIIAPEAISSIEFCRNTGVVFNDFLPSIFLRCPKLTNVTDAFRNCRELTKGFEFVGASDTIDNYNGVFYDCVNIDPLTLPKPWSWVGMSGYPSDMIGIDGYKNIPNLPADVPTEWGGPGTETTPNSTMRSATPVIRDCNIGSRYFTVDLRNKSLPGDMIEVAMVDPNNRSSIKGNMIKRIIHVSDTVMVLGIYDICGRDTLSDKDCVRVRFREMNRNEPKIFSDYVYQVPTVRIGNKPSRDIYTKIIAFKSMEV